MDLNLFLSLKHCFSKKKVFSSTLFLFGSILPSFEKKGFTIFQKAYYLLQKKELSC